MAQLCFPDEPCEIGWKLHPAIPGLLAKSECIERRFLPKITNQASGTVAISFGGALYRVLRLFQARAAVDTALFKCTRTKSG